MNARAIIASVFVFGLIMFAYSLAPYEQELMKNEQVFVGPENPLKFHIFAYGGSILIAIKNAGAGPAKVSAYLDRSAIPLNKWTPVDGVGNHTLTLKSASNCTVVLSLFVKGTDMSVVLAFLLLTAVAGILMLWVWKKP